MAAVPSDAIVIVWSDHGYHLGEKFHWKKSALWERSTRIPLIIRGPDGIGAGQRATAPVSLIDLYATVLELAGVKGKSDIEGKSLAPMLGSPDFTDGNPALMIFGQDNYAVRSDRYRYIRYRNGAEELYDMIKDPNEWQNLSSAPAYDEAKNELQTHIPRFC